jgi:hypothetical protein
MNEQQIVLDVWAAAYNRETEGKFGTVYTRVQLILDQLFQQEGGVETDAELRRRFVKDPSLFLNERTTNVYQGLLEEKMEKNKAAFKVQLQQLRRQEREKKISPEEQASRKRDESPKRKTPPKEDTPLQDDDDLFGSDEE